MKTIFLDGKYLKVQDKLIEAFTPGIFKAKGVFETMLGLDGLVLDAEVHLKRLRKGLKILGLKAPVIRASILREVLRLNHLPCARVRLMVWQGGRQMHVMVAALPYKISDGKPYRVCLIKTNRPANGRLAQVKSLDYGLFAGAYDAALSRGFDEALLLNKRGHIFEASRANIFWVKDGILHTPPLSSGCLNGITRQQIMTQARRMKIPLKERILTPQVLKKADEVFLINSLIRMKSVEKISEF
jgi:branched-chain amino acid aminotransferase